MKPYVILALLALAPAALFALSPDECPGTYCEGGVYYSECRYMMSTYQCTCTTMRGCPYGCNSLGTECAASVVNDPRCPDQCYEGILHYGGWWSEDYET
ncbi:MAG: hypothetical protein PHF51_03275, partial [Candidatus ainarchaeum sp.]|nr:hypothetical protein [Candidatus ainarchaeum sp.]